MHVPISLHCTIPTGTPGPAVSAEALGEQAGHSQRGVITTQPMPHDTLAASGPLQRPVSYSYCFASRYYLASRPPANYTTPHNPHAPAHQSRALRPAPARTGGGGVIRLA